MSMSYAQLERLAAAHNLHLTSEQMSDIKSCPPSSALLYLLPPCIFLLAIDVVLRLSNRPPPIVNEPLDIPEAEDPVVRKLAVKAQEVLANFKKLDDDLSAEEKRSRHLARMIQKQRNFAHHRRRIGVYMTRKQLEGSPQFDAMNGEATAMSGHPSGVSEPFNNFCERLLLQNKIWKQHREIKALKNVLHDIRESDSSNAFKVFIERLLLTNKIWKQEKEISRLLGETEALKRSRVAAVTRAAKQMVQDVRKERLTEEFVKDLIAELEECKDSIGKLRAEHEREIQELAGEWRKDCRRLAQQVDRLELAQESRRVEQELSNEMEADLVHRLSVAEGGEEVNRTPSGLSGTYSCDDDAETLSDSDFEQMSNASTCVGSGGDRSPNGKIEFVESSADKLAPTNIRKVRLSPLKLIRESSSSSVCVSSPATKSPVRKLEPGPYAGFSFNPLFFGNASALRNEDDTETESPSRRVTFSLKPAPERTALHPKSAVRTTAKETRQTKRVQWRI
ncbi:hypothetical protein M413DRAFT_450077 [Hebeloma cylindrosporum]|uniref:Uncharacterized protein n=1 Tax=Hebeloma cylindrosporum TaxID=76867 RepID=A0A0C3BTT1_HEBCY|nr:hypothetical protein M413DRAFT_450077 [Hebeloma cylindrosporum h7]